MREELKWHCSRKKATHHKSGALQGVMLCVCVCMCVRAGICLSVSLYLSAFLCVCSRMLHLTSRVNHSSPLPPQFPPYHVPLPFSPSSPPSQPKSLTFPLNTTVSINLVVSSLKCTLRTDVFADSCSPPFRKGIGERRYLF